MAFSSSAALNPHRIPIGTSDEETSCATMEETFPTADTKRLEEKHDGWLGVGVGWGLAVQLLGGGTKRLPPLDINYQKEVQDRGSSSTIEVH